MKQTWLIAVGSVTIFFDAASVVACTWLLWKVGSTKRRQLLPIQLVNLALADMLYSSMEAWIVSVSLVHRSESKHTIIWSGMVLGMWTSLLLEVHIATGFLALYWRVPRLMMFLQRTVSLAWVVALLIVVFLDVAATVRVDIVVDEAIIIVAFVMTAALYVMAWFRSRWFPLRGKQRASSMVWLYPATFFVTMAPALLYAKLNMNKFNTDSVISAPFIALNGLLNVLVYSCHSRFSCVMVRDMAEVQRTAMTQWAGLSSLPVGFSWSGPQQCWVPAVQSAALHRSEREIADIERARATEWDTDTESTISTFEISDGV